MHLIRRVPFTLVFLATMVAANWIAGTLGGLLPSHALANWGISHYDVLHGEVFRLLTGTFLSHDFGMFLRQLMFVSCVIGSYEWFEGNVRAIVVFFTIDLIGTLLVLFAILPFLVGLPNEIGEAALASHDVGMSAGGFGLIGALVAKQRHSLLLLTLIFVAISIKIWVNFEIIADTAHLVCLFLGFAFQTLLTEPKREN